MAPTTSSPCACVICVRTERTPPPRARGASSVHWSIFGATTSWSLTTGPPLPPCLDPLPPLTAARRSRACSTGRATRTLVRDATFDSTPLVPSRRGTGRADAAGALPLLVRGACARTRADRRVSPTRFVVDVLIGHPGAPSVGNELLGFARTAQMHGLLVNDLGQIGFPHAAQHA